MSRALFMIRLKEGLAGMPQSDIDAILSDYDFHFAEAAAAGQSEGDVAARLGDPARLARELRGDMEYPYPTDIRATPSVLRRRGILALLLVAFGALGAATYHFVTHNDTQAPASSPVSSGAARSMAAPANTIRVEISGNQTFDLGTITQERLEIIVDGGGRATAQGRVRELTVHVDGSGTADFGAIQADIVHVDVSGTGTAEVSATQMADVTIAGSGFVRLKVRPKMLKRSVTGFGQVIVPG